MSYNPASPDPHYENVPDDLPPIFLHLEPRKIALSLPCRVVLAAYKAGCGTVDWRHYPITIKPYCVLRRALQLGGTGSDESSRGGMVVDLGNERDVADCVLRAHGRPRSNANASASMDGSGGGGYETAGSEA